MKFAIILVACLVAVAYAEDDTEVIAKYSEASAVDFKYGYDLSNFISVKQEGKLKNQDSWYVEGMYEYISKDGKPIKVTYTADDYGYHPKVEK